MPVRSQRTEQAGRQGSQAPSALLFHGFKLGTSQGSLAVLGFLKLLLHLNWQQVISAPALWLCCQHLLWYCRPERHRPGCQVVEDLFGYRVLAETAELREAAIDGVIGPWEVLRRVRVSHASGPYLFAWKPRCHPKLPHSTPQTTQQCLDGFVDNRSSHLRARVHSGGNIQESVTPG